MRPSEVPLPLQFYLRTQHVDLLRSLASSSGFSVSKSFAHLLKSARKHLETGQGLASKKARVHLNVSAEDEEFLQALMRRWGLTRSAVVQKLIEEAAEGRLPVFAANEDHAT